MEILDLIDKLVAGYTELSKNTNEGFELVGQRYEEITNAIGAVANAMVSLNERITLLEDIIAKNKIDIALRNRFM